MILYNEIDPFAATWLEKLIAAGELPLGIVDRRSIHDLKGDDCAEMRGLRRMMSAAP